MLLNHGTLIPGMKVLVTVDNWFYGPDGRQYRAIYGTIIGVFSDEQTLGVKTNARSTNWYAQIGSCVVAGCQIHYAVAAGNPPSETATDWTTHEGKVIHYERPSAVLNADAFEAWPDVLAIAQRSVIEPGQVTTK